MKILEDKSYPMVTEKPVAFRFARRGFLEYMEAVVLADLDFLVHAFCTRRGGVSEGTFSSLNFSVREGDTIENVRQNWEIVAAAFNLRVDDFLVVNQVHSDRILMINHPLFDREGYCITYYDAVITDQPQVAIAIKTADCVPVLFVDREKRVIGIAHAGWRGTSLNISGKVVTAMREQFSSQASDITAVIGPSIGPCCYQVDGRVYQAMEMESEHWLDAVFFPCCDPERWMLNLPLANKLQIMERGVLGNNIHIAEYCTSCHRDVFFSHRGERGNTGRQLNFIMLKGNKRDSF